MKSKPKHQSRCDWREDEDGNWNTGCGNKHVLLSGTPAHNGMKFCCYCGASLRSRPVKFGAS
jgi:hypothetical protein